MTEEFIMPKSKWFDPAEWLAGDYLDQAMPIFSCLPRLDTLLGGGFYPGMWCIMAEPGAGKSAFGLQLAFFNAWNKRNVAYISLEMPAHQCWSRIASAWSYCCNYEYRFKWSDVPNMGRKAASAITVNGTLERSRIFESDDLMARAPMALETGSPGLMISDGNGERDIASVLSLLRDAKAQDTELAIVDYLQQIATVPGAKTYERVSEVSAALKDVANELKIPLVVIVAMNRESMRGKEPDMHGGSGSAGIEYDACGILTLKRIDDKSTRDCKRVELRIQKNRYGYSGESVMLDYWPAYNVFKEAKDHAANNDETE